MEHLWSIGAPIIGAALLALGVVLPFRTSRVVEDPQEELALVSDSGASIAEAPEAPTLSQRLLSGFTRSTSSAHRVRPSETDAAEFAETLSAHVVQTPEKPLTESETESDGRDELAQAYEEQERLLVAAHERRRRELEEIAIAEDARARAEGRSRCWYLRLDPDLEAPTAEQRMALASWLAIPAPFAAKLLILAFEQEDIPRVRARIIGALAGGDHFDDPAPYEIAFENGGVEKAAVWEVLAPRRSDVAWAQAILER